MASSRLIQCDLFEDDFVGSLNFFERLLWIGLFGAVADDQGRFLDHPALVRVKVFLYDANVTDDKVEQALIKLATAGKIIRYSVSGKRLCQITNWWKHQKPSWASESRYPPPEGWQDRIKMHVAGGKVLLSGWDTPGGFCDSPGGLGSGLGSDIPSGLGSGIKEVKDKDKGKGKAEAENKLPAAAAVHSPADDPPKTRISRTENADVGELCREYEANLGVLTPMIVERIGDLTDRYPRDWISTALREAVAHEARNLKYVEAILSRWRRDGFQSQKGAPSGGRQNRSVDAIEKWLQEDDHGDET